MPNKQERLDYQKKKKNRKPHVFQRPLLILSFQFNSVFRGGGPRSIPNRSTNILIILPSGTAFGHTYLIQNLPSRNDCCNCPHQSQLLSLDIYCPVPIITREGIHHHHHQCHTIQAGSRRHPPTRLLSSTNLQTHTHPPSNMFARKRH